MSIIDWECKESEGCDYAIVKPFGDKAYYLSEAPIFEWDEKDGCEKWFSDGQYFDFYSNVFNRPKIKYLVVKCSDGFSGVDIEVIGEFTNIHSAIKLHKSKDTTQYTWHKIEVEYDD